MERHSSSSQQSVLGILEKWNKIGTSLPNEEFLLWWDENHYLKNLFEKSWIWVWMIRGKLKCQDQQTIEESYRPWRFPSKNVSFQIGEMKFHVIMAQLIFLYIFPTFWIDVVFFIRFFYHYAFTLRINVSPLQPDFSIGLSRNFTQ